MTETSGPRGRISLIKAVGEARLDLLSPGFVEQMWECLDCRACEAVCPSGVPYGQLVESARAQIRHAQTPATRPVDRALRNFLVRTIFLRPAMMRFIALFLRLVQRTRLTALAGPAGLGRLARFAPPIDKEFFVASGQRFEAAKPEGLAFLHTGCVMPFTFAPVHRATVRMLRRGGLSVTVPRGQGCCGAIAAHDGAPEVARELARRNIEAFERSGADVYVTNAAGCGSALKDYGPLFRDDALWAERARAFSSRVRDVTEILDAIDLPPPPRSLDAVVTYQDPCHLVHAQRIAGAPRRLLRRIEGLRIAEMPEGALCCGGAGIYNLTHPQMSQRLLERKVDAIRATGAAMVVTANPGCALQIAAGLRDARCPAGVKHVVELLDEAYTDGLN